MEKENKFLSRSDTSKYTFNTKNTLFEAHDSSHRLPVRRLVWRCTSEPERDKSVFGVASMSRLSGFRGNQTGHARANVQSPHLRLL